METEAKQTFTGEGQDINKDVNPQIAPETTTEVKGPQVSEELVDSLLEHDRVKAFFETLCTGLDVDPSRLDRVERLTVMQWVFEAAKADEDLAKQANNVASMLPVPGLDGKTLAVQIREAQAASERKFRDSRPTPLADANKESERFARHWT